jgi:hypothetical protein
MFDKEFTLRPTRMIINGPWPLAIVSTTTKGRNVVMVSWGAQEGEGQNNVDIYMAFEEWAQKVVETNGLLKV